MLRALALLCIAVVLLGGCAHHHPRRPDRDRDGIPDDEDACPAIVGVAATSPSTRGCPPPRLDMDADGIPDDEDACPRDPGNRFGDARKGCWTGDPDRDHDGIPDREDVCPDIAGDRTYDERTSGCPLPADRDRDGIADADDACPDVPGKRSSDEKKTGCPPATDKIRVEGDQILLGDVIFFDVDSPRVRHASWLIVKKLAAFINDTPDILTVDLEGYADEVGAPEHNLRLSKDRADAVKKLLVKYGVAEKKLTTHAYGEDHPHLKGHDLAARSQNRRVEVTISNARLGEEPERAVDKKAAAITP